MLREPRPFAACPWWGEELAPSGLTRRGRRRVRSGPFRQDGSPWLVSAGRKGGRRGTRIGLPAPLPGPRVWFSSDAVQVRPRGSPQTCPGLWRARWGRKRSLLSAACSVLRVSGLCRGAEARAGIGVLAGGEALLSRRRRSPVCILPALTSPQLCVPLPSRFLTP